MASKEKEKEKPEVKEEDIQYVVYVRLPFNRGDFVDPPPVKWDETKSECLWGIISGPKAEINWPELAAQFEVTVEFLIQMASYLTERHTSQLKAQMRRAATAHGSHSNAPSPVPGAEPAPFHPHPEAIRRTGSAAGRAPSALSVRKDAPPPHNEMAAVAGQSGKLTLPLRPPVSRNSSAGTAVLTQNQIAAKAAAAAAVRTSDGPPRRRGPSLGISTAQPAASPVREGNETQLSSPLASTSPSSSSDESPVQSRIIRRPPRFQPADGAGVDDDDDEAEPAFLPFKPQNESTPTPGNSGLDLGATLRGDVRDFGRRLPRDAKAKGQIHQSQTSDSSTSSAAMVPRNPTRGDRAPPGPLSPRRTAELAGRSPAGKGKGISREGSDGTPSMGSSFSDLDDASVTQSALEEALASRMQDGTIGSRMSTLGQAIRSRYASRPNEN
ncbi:hypothetical protein B0T16DRAFT_399480 [Cercophora newfieldiana]|uniref:Autophagy-related protein 29 n=1 Tax=Cercophora newfieldiana TaxID=92897 RepID=A0AA40CZQ8_9PEZI|nr:hypothetical protein B0T16DRAFT_399480 [Cercophora newfieldiana]